MNQFTSLITFFYKDRYSTFSALPNFNAYFRISLASERQLTDSLRSSRAGSAVLKAKKVRQCLNWWNDTVMGLLTDFGYKNKWSNWTQHNPPPPTMIAKGCRLLIFCLNVSTAVHLSMKFKLTNRCAFYATSWKEASWLSCCGKEWAGMVWSPFSVFV